MNTNVLYRLAQYVSSEYPRAAELFIKALQERVLPQFARLDSEAEQFAQGEYERLGQLPSSGEEPFFLGDLAEQAHDSAITWYQTMRGVRQSLINLHAVGLRHLFEQQLFDLVTHARLSERGDADFREDCKAVEELGVQLSDLPAWGKLEELRLLSNTIKHAEGRSSVELKELRPELFVAPVVAELPFVRRPGPTIQPLAGEDVYLQEDELDVYCSAIGEFWISVGKKLDSQSFM